MNFAEHLKVLSIKVIKFFIKKSNALGSEKLHYYIVKNHKAQCNRIYYNSEPFGSVCVKRDYCILAH